MSSANKLDEMLGRLAGHRERLGSLAQPSLDEFLADRNIADSAKYNLVVAIEGCIDISNHIISTRLYRFPQDNADSLVVLAENGILSDADVPAYRAMSRFRYRLVHICWEVDDHGVWEILQDKLVDFDRFSEAVSMSAQ